MKAILIEIISFLKRKNSNYINTLSCLDSKGWNALFLAIDSSENGLPEIVELLVRSGIDVNFQDSKGISALHLACYKGQDDNVELLIKNKANVNAKDTHGSMFLIHLI